ncbi:hypothetical protein D910_12562 [Dendroctonus ponderosae]
MYGSPADFPWRLNNVLGWHFFDNYLLMDDNGRPHRALIVREYLNEVGVQRLEGTTRSPDLNVIAHVWELKSSNDIFDDEILLLRTWLNRKTRLFRNGITYPKNSLQTFLSYSKTFDVPYSS